MLLTAGMVFVSCEDDYAETGRDSPGKLSRNQLSKKVIIIGLGLSGLVAGNTDFWTTSGHENT